ncbi:hypothetical protein LG200_04045 [Methylobacillus caricis]|uniref:hypothetical protein n=1 Tax=Methylobacillus caricis TaxID=1971611 RepID=UPI001CFF8D14|nr:hypothetical protein [Methylobacillus caricis]MCB5187175.1 hypothetical protein [Methylobacillus caricis]
MQGKVESVKASLAGQDQMQDWAVMGIQHEIFMRVFPSLRHSLVGPISIARMSAAIIKRTLAKGDIGKAVLNEQVARIDQQLEEAVLGIRALQIWESTAKAMATPAEIIQLGIKLMTAPLALRNIKIDYVPGDVLDIEEMRQQPFLYAWLGLLCYFEDHISEPVTLRLEQKEPRSVCVEITHPLYAVKQRQGFQLNHAIIDQHALQTLAHAGGLTFKFGKEWTSFGWDDLGDSAQ